MGVSGGSELFDAQPLPRREQQQQEHDDIDAMIATLAPNSEAVRQRAKHALAVKALEEQRTIDEEVGQLGRRLLAGVRDSAAGCDHDALVVWSRSSPSSAWPAHIGAATPMRRDATAWVFQTGQPGNNKRLQRILGSGACVRGRERRGTRK